MSTPAPTQNSADLAPTAQRRVTRVRHEPRRRALRVAQVLATSPGFVSVRFEGDDLHDFASLSFDDHVKFICQDAQGQTQMRDYTPRQFDPQAGSLTLEFALHQHGPATDWARRARPGDLATVAGPRGSMVIDPLHDWHLLACDATGLPAVCRRLEELPEGTRALVLVDLADVRDQRPLASAAQLQVQWVQGAEAWLAALAALRLPAGEGFAWCAGEARVVARAREVLAQHHGLPREAMRVAAYWKQGAQSFHERIEG